MNGLAELMELLGLDPRTVAKRKLQNAQGSLLQPESTLGAWRQDSAQEGMDIADLLRQLMQSMNGRR